MVTIDYLDSERKKIWERIVELQEAIDKKTSELESDARSASKKCSEYKNKCESAKNEANQLLLDVKNITGEIDQSGVLALITEIQSFHSELLPKKDILKANIAELEGLFANYAIYVEQIKKLGDTSTSSDESSKKIQTILNQFIIKKDEIDELYYEIFGFTETDEATGKTTTVEGLKAELMHSFANLEAGFEALALEKDKEFKEFSLKINQEFSDALTGWKNEYITVYQKIESLLPRALTTGLSYAYSEKKDAEVAENIALQKVFRNYVFGLIGISLIPFGISVYLLFTGVPLEETILKMPRLVFSILPLYVPVLWVAYSSNRKMNLSKRLIEEYTHKEVLSKTFEGLSKQIQSIEDSEISSDLKARLLYNILEVSSENPGKLISDYNKSDHPLMDALDKSVKLTNAVEHLSKIPGMSKLVSILESKSKKVIEKEVGKAVAGLEKVVADKA